MANALAAHPYAKHVLSQPQTAHHVTSPHQTLTISTSSASPPAPQPITTTTSIYYAINARPHAKNAHQSAFILAKAALRHTFFPAPIV